MQLRQFTDFFSKTAFFLQAVELLPSLDVSEDYCINSETARVAPLSTHLSMKVGYAVRFENLPAPERAKNDRIFTAGLQFNW